MSNLTEIRDDTVERFLETIGDMDKIHLVLLLIEIRHELQSGYKAKKD